MKDARHDSGRPCLLFVDDEQAIRATLPAILETEGFDVAVAATVSEALKLINRHKFDVLLTDLNIGSAADGFILVSAMRRVQPTAATFILTGYPDFQTALEAIRQQVDDYFTKPADIPTLVSALRERSRKPRCWDESPCKRASNVLLEKLDEIIQRWSKEVSADPRLASIRIGEAERTESLPHLLKDLSKALEAGQTQIPAESLVAAASHGANRAKQGYTIPLLVTETRTLNRVVAAILQAELLNINLSTLIPDSLKIGEYLQALLEESIRAFQATQKSFEQDQSDHRQLGRTVKAKAR